MTLHTIIIDILNQPSEKIDLVEQFAVACYFTGFVIGFFLIRMYMTVGLTHWGEPYKTLAEFTFYCLMSLLGNMYAPASWLWAIYWGGLCIAGDRRFYQHRTRLNQSNK